MAKFLCEIDTETKKASFYKDGMEIFPEDFSIGSYSNISCAEDAAPKRTTYVDYSYKQSDQSTIRIGFSFKEGEDLKYSESSNRFDFVKEVGMLHQKSLALNDLSRALSKQKST